ncbi:MAG: ATP-dependent endonuclease [Dehalococcoidia bacterium]
MLLSKVRIENFRGITTLEIDLDPTTVLIGENNVGKSTVLDALSVCLSRGLGRRSAPFSEYDFHLADGAAQPAQAPTIRLTLTFQESKEQEWPNEIAQTFVGAIQSLDDGRQQLTFRVQSQYDEATRDFPVEWSFLDLKDNPLPGARNARLVPDLQQLAPLFFLAALRDASQHFSARAPFWAPFTKNVSIGEQKRSELEAQIQAVNQAVLEAHEPFAVVKDQLARTGTLMPLANTDPVSIEAIPLRIFDLLTRTQVKLASRSGAKLPLTTHGSGTQSLTVIFLFQAFLQAQLRESFTADSAPILALEEPETHLHPSAIRALWETLFAMEGQKIITTHSGDLLGAVPLSSVRRLARKNGVVQVFRVGDATLDERDQQKVSYHIRAKRGALLFARCWLLVEGETEFTAIPELGRLLGFDFELAGIACVEFAQCGLRPLIRVARDLGIEWHVLADGDPAGGTYVQTAMALLGPDSSNERVTRLSVRDFEHAMWNAGFSYVYADAVDTAHQGLVTALPGTPEHASQTIEAAVKSTSKPNMAYAVLAAAANALPFGPPAIPVELKQAIETVIRLARAAD